MSKTVGPISTDTGPGTINTPAGEANPHAHVLDADEQKALKGKSADVKIGEEGDDPNLVPAGSTGYVDLDDEGKPTGTIQKQKVPGKPQAAVVNRAPITADELLTPAGAPLTERMNPNPDGYDPGFAARNPAGAAPKAPEYPDKGGIAPGAYGTKTPDYSKPPEPAPTPKADTTAKKE